jgi:hypothetical protein
MSFGKSSNTGEKFERADLQPVIESQLAHLLSERGVTLELIDVVHGRRTIRALVRVAARIAKGLGCDTRTFALLAVACFTEERALKQKAQA